MIGILDLNIGNLRSVAKAVDLLGFDYTICQDAARFDDLTHLILPGVGHFNAAMNNVSESNLQKNLQHFVESGRPLMGICLGMQLLAKSSEEGGHVTGLGFIDANVCKFTVSDGKKLPHIGWNTVKFCYEHPISENVKDTRDFYFVHSYHYQLNNPADQIAVTDYEYEFPSIVGRNNIIGLQFHPEKSQKNGLKLLENFLEWNGQC